MVKSLSTTKKPQRLHFLPAWFAQKQVRSFRPIRKISAILSWNFIGQNLRFRALLQAFASARVLTRNQKSLRIQISTTYATALNSGYEKSLKPSTTLRLQRTTKKLSGGSSPLSKRERSGEISLNSHCFLASICRLRKNCFRADTVSSFMCRLAKM